MLLPDEARQTAENHGEISDREEYQAGYEARLASVSEYRTATSSWRAGWQEADRELTAREGRHLPENPTVYALLTAVEDGGIGRTCCMAFDESRSEQWKRSWIRTDIELGTRAGKRNDA